MDDISSVIREIVVKLYGLDVDVSLERPDEQFGDYATNISLQLAGQLGKSPRAIAEEISGKLAELGKYESVEIAGPGFINIRLNSEALLVLAKRGISPERAGQTIVAETNNPNPFKAMHIGHAMNAIVADTVANLLAADGATLKRVSYHGDIGLHVGKSMHALLNYAGGDIEKIRAVPESEHNRFMSQMYAEGSKVYKDDESAKDEINKLAEQSFAPPAGLYADIYELCMQWSFDQIDKAVARLGNQSTVARYLESAADERGIEIVKSNTPNVFKQSDGAYIFEGSKYGSFDNVFVARTGRGLYAARDLGLMELKNQQFHPDKSYIITGNEQGPYFKGIIAAAELCDPSLEGQTVNIPTGLVKLSTGKMSSRDGKIVEIAWLFDQFSDSIKSRGGEPTDDIIAGALRYQFLKVKIGGDIVFDINEAVSLTGNTGNYLQYAHARARSILAKTELEVEMPREVRSEDRGLVRKLGEYSEVVDVAKRQLEPHHICTYLFELAQTFNRYYELNHVIGDAHEAHRVGLVALYAHTLEAGLAILGIAAPDKM
ncbi:MAG: arginine--tRNA ligase [Candidatus Saccharimonas sp.]